MKTCIKCNQDKEDNQFALKKNKSGSYSIRSTCKPCMNERNKERRKIESGSARDSRLLKQKEWNASNRDKVNALKAEYRMKTKIIKISLISHDAHIAAYLKYRSKISSMMFDNHVKDWNRQTALKARWRTKHDINYLTNMRMRVSIRKALKGRKSGRRWESIVGYNIGDLITHFNKTMPKGYTLEDAFNGRLHIDHIVPKSLFDMSNEANVKKAWCISNLRLIPSKENLMKSSKNVYLV